MHRPCIDKHGSSGKSGRASRHSARENTGKVAVFLNVTPVVSVPVRNEEIAKMTTNAAPENTSAPCITDASKPMDQRVKRLVELGEGISLQQAQDWIDFYDKYKPTPLEIIALMDECDPIMVAMRQKKAVQP